MPACYCTAGMLIKGTDGRKVLVYCLNLTNPSFKLLRLQGSQIPPVSYSHVLLFIFVPIRQLTYILIPSRASEPAMCGSTYWSSVLTQNRPRCPLIIMRASRLQPSDVAWISVDPHDVTATPLGTTAVRGLVDGDPVAMRIC
jgi:hypothetical protein